MVMVMDMYMVMGIVVDKVRVWDMVMAMTRGMVMVMDMVWVRYRVV